MGIPLVRGRGFTERDNEQGARACIVINETMAAKYWPGEDPIGKRITISYNKTGPREIVGVVGDVKQGDLADAHAPQMYTPFVQTPWPFLAAVVRTTAAPEAAAGSLRAGAGAARSDAGGRRNPHARPIRRRGRSRRRASRRCSSAASPALALLLAGFGLYGVMAYSVAQRRREIGIRMALGAQAGDVRALVVCAGAADGRDRPGDRPGRRAVRDARARQPAVRRHRRDPVTFAAVSRRCSPCSSLAAYLPARRATRVDPMVALRTE